MMRYKKGNLVEVLDESEPPSGSWRCAEIVSGHGDDYIVRYSTCDTSGALFRLASKPLIRPCPPLVEFSENWVPGDVVEVFLKYTWRMARVTKVVGKKQVLVRLVGSPNEFKVKKCNIRVRQLWEDGQWAKVGKGPTQKYTRISQFRSTGAILRINKVNLKFQKPDTGISRTSNRGLPPYSHSWIEANVGKEGKSSSETHFTESDGGSSICSSVGSCSSTSSYQLSMDPACDELQSVGESVPELDQEIHRLELCAYRATMEALFASGPLSWEKETLITNLRVYLNISNDEHLLEFGTCLVRGIWLKWLKFSKGKAFGGIHIRQMNPGFMAWWCLRFSLYLLNS
ncbi:unnamed protein product [Cuscuta europaea]|uniref:ENT domain-containing protein n=1 Tax=Cuscuta europaea TaxID=41803 RepID=A0A9P0Z463_CUSEU|nr:unnamed protein product [Cuscuta europaea]